MAVWLWLLYAVIALLTVLVYRSMSRLNYWQAAGIPCEKPSRLVGSFKGAQRTRTFAAIWESYYKRFKGTGPFAGFYWFHRPAVLVLDPELVKQVLIRDFTKFTDRGFYYNEEDDPLSGQLFMLDGHKWKSMRNKLSPTFTSGKMKFMFPTVLSVGQEFVKAFDGLIKESAVIEVKELLARFATDVIGTCAFGIDCNSLKDPEAEFRIMGKKIFTDQRYGKFGIIIVNSFPKLARLLHMKVTPDHIEKFFMRIVRENVENRERSGIRRNDFMDMLIDLKNNKMMQSEVGEDMRGLTLGEVAAQAFVFFAAGFETSSTTMGFALYELARNPDIQQRVRDEINTVLAQHNQEYTYECMKELVFMGQVLAETLRLYTVLPILNRVSLEDYVVPGHPKYIIKKDMPVLIPASAIHRDPDYYPNPDVFNPDNFEPELVKTRDSVLWLPFGDGPRNCIGSRFGHMQMRVGLALLLKKFKFSVCDETPIPLEFDKRNFMVSSVGGIKLRVDRV